MVIELLSDPETFVRAKAIYALSGAIKHFEPALQEFKNVDGFKTLIDLLNNENGKHHRSGDSIGCLYRFLFFLSSFSIERTLD